MEQHTQTPWKADCYGNIFAEGEAIASPPSFANAKRIVLCVNSHDKLLEALIKAGEDINWMLNNRQFLNPEVFDYIDEAITEAEGG